MRVFSIEERQMPIDCLMSMLNVDKRVTDVFKTAEIGDYSWKQIEKNVLY